MKTITIQKPILLCKCALEKCLNQNSEKRYYKNVPNRKKKKNQSLTICLFELGFLWVSVFVFIEQLNASRYGIRICILHNNWMSPYQNVLCVV